MEFCPEIKELKKLETISQKKGSGIVYEDLLGTWKFQYVWGKDSDEVQNIASSILRVFSAKLELKRKNKEDKLNFKIQNSINFGLLKITFLGNAELRGKRPLLVFCFEDLKINIGSLLIIKKQFKKPDDKKMPFFSLIGLDTKEDWMCARGRGGGLAIWIKY